MARVKQDELAFYDGVAARIRRLLARPGSGLTTAWLARRVGRSRATVSKFLNRTSITISTYLLVKIAVALNVSVAYLMVGHDQPQVDTD